jgi:hypothetical protein
MIVSEKPDLDEDLLVHFGIKGMKWGQKKTSSSGDSPGKKPMSTKKKVAIGAAAVAGATAVAFVIARRGKTQMPPAFRNSTTTSKGKAASSTISQSEWKKRVADLRADMASANADQDRWMRRQGLGAHLNKKTSDVDMGNISDVRRALNDPNHVWEL